MSFFLIWKVIILCRRCYSYSLIKTVSCLCSCFLWSLLFRVKIGKDHASMVQEKVEQLEWNQPSAWHPLFHHTIDVRIFIIVCGRIKLICKCVMCREERRAMILKKKKKKDKMKRQNWNHDLQESKCFHVLLGYMWKYVLLF